MFLIIFLISVFILIISDMKDSSKNIKICAFHIFKVQSLENCSKLLNFMNFHFSILLFQIKLHYSSSIHLCSSIIFFKQVFVANPNKSQDIIDVLVENHEELLKLLHVLPVTTGTSRIFLIWFCITNIEWNQHSAIYYLK
jgi:hypothetical protein